MAVAAAAPPQCVKIKIDMTWAPTVICAENTQEIDISGKHQLNIIISVARLFPDKTKTQTRKQKKPTPNTMLLGVCDLLDEVLIWTHPDVLRRKGLWIYLTTNIMGRDVHHTRAAAGKLKKSQQCRRGVIGESVVQWPPRCCMAPRLRASRDQIRKIR